MLPFLCLGAASIAVGDEERIHAPGLEPPAEPALYAAAVPSDTAGRMLASVEVNGTGPYRFIIDLGANRSALSSRLADHLGLVAANEATIAVHGVTGTAIVPLVEVASLTMGNLALVGQRLPVLSGSVFADADGILGIDGLQDARIDVDVDRGRVSIEQSERRRAPRGYLTVRARLVNNGLLIVSGRVGRIPTEIVIDTGAEYTIGNMALQQALTRPTGKRRHAEAAIHGATPGSVRGETRATPSIQIGQARLSNLPVTYGDLHIFSVWGLVEQPALIIGMDALGTVQRFVVDYPRREFHIKTRAPSRVSVGNCTSANCASRLRGRT